jgi:hypothetical protein
MSATSCKPASRPEQVFLGIPCGDGRLDMGTAQAILKAPMQVRCAPAFNAFSLLACNFNFLFTTALNLRSQGITHFCMLHNDVAPQSDTWLTDLLNEMILADADAISAVVPIKNDQGLTSTGLDYSGLPDARPFACRRLTMTEIMQMPETFDADEAEAHLSDFPSDQIDPVLLINTGLLLIDIRKPWVESVKFQVLDEVRSNPETGVMECFTDPEDWNFSRQLHGLGVRYVATRKVHVQHAGRASYDNSVAWGRCKTDPAFAHESIEEPVLA